MTNPPQLAALLPRFATELASSLHEMGETQLATQVAELSIWSMCACNDGFCSSFYTEPRPSAGWTGEFTNVLPPVDAGIVVLDVVNQRIRFVEVLWRDDVASCLQDSW